MHIAHGCRPEQLHLDDALFGCLFGFLAFGEDLDDMIFYGELYEVSQR